MKTRKLWTTALAAFMIAAFIGGCKDENVETVGLCPLVISTNPANLATNVPLDQVITVTFNEPMNPLTITPGAFSLSSPSGARVGSSTKNQAEIPGSLTYDAASNSMVFTPTAKLKANAIYTGTVATSVKDVAGNALQVAYVWTFSTIGSPTVISTDPVNNATNVVISKIVTATFSSPMDPLTINATTFKISQGATAVAGTVSYTGSTASFAPTNPLAFNTIYTGTITTSAKNVAGGPLVANYVWSFNTGGSPSVISTDPLDLAINVVFNKVIKATFSEAMDPLTITASSFTLKTGASSVLGAVSYTGTTASFTPTSNLLASTIYTATVTTVAKNIAGNPMTSNKVWSFTTASIPSVLSTDPLNLAIGVALNKVIGATFSEAMDPLTISSTSFTVMAGVVVVPGAVTYAGTTATFTPTSNLLPSTTYTATLTTAAMSLIGIPLANDFVWTFTTGAPPTVISTDPIDLATAIALNKVISATFSEAMDPSTLTTSTFKLMNGVTPVLGAVTYAGTTASFTPTANLLPNTTYTATITTGANSLNGIAMGSNTVWSFTTIVSPTVLSTDPLNLATGVALNKVIGATFSVAMDPLTLTTSTFTLMNGVTPVLGAVNYAGTTATFMPTANLLAGITYTATITTGAKNVAGTPLASNYVWTFTTINASVPTVLSTDPLNLATGVALNKVISATFSEAMDPLTISGSTFTLMTGVTPVTGVVNYSGTTATFTPTSNLLSGNTYTATITTGAKSLLAIPLASNYVWTFNTVAPLGPLAVDLKSVARFGIIAGVGVSNNAGFSVINDLDVGISPGVRSSVTGFPPAIVVNGAIYASDDLAPPGTAAMLTQAKQDLTDAYLFAEGATSPAPATVAGNQGGLTLAPGIYKSASTLSIDGSPLTLDAQGDVNAVWIFQIAAGFTTTTGGSVILIGGAKAKNVFWQVGSSAIIGDNTSFKGNVLALSSITMNTNAVAEGRMLARNAAVVMTSTNTINKPSN